MILQNYEFAVYCRDGLVYDGTAEFGFFHPDALTQQIGIRDARPYELTADEKRNADSFRFPVEAPYPDSRWRMIDQVDALDLGGGRHGLGFVQGSARVNPDAWFFKAHFLGDPVWPGSLGLESLLQLLKVIAVARYGGGAGVVFESPALGQLHRWTYRGQIIPTNSVVAVQAEIKAWDDKRRFAVADGTLGVDGKVIYQMNNFSILIS
jgi:3-hydroxymyristoyl/3-hydroxydecanoyl-(acyl carrier protein) dehydratase